MSEETAPSDAVVEGGDLGTPEQAQDSTPTEPSFDWSQYADQEVEVKVGGETVRVPLSEALNGYSRQADYTQKTQELAEQRNEAADALAIFEALRTDPKGTLEYLAQLVPAEPDPDESATDRTLRELQEWKAQQESASQLAEVDRELDALAAKYEDVDRAAVLQHAVDIGAPNLEVAYRDLRFPDVLSAAQQKAADDAARTAADEEASEAKRGAFAPEGGRSPARGSIQNFGTGEKPSFRDAVQKAYAEHRGGG